MQAEFMQRRVAQGLVAALFASLLVVAGPAAPKAQAIPGWVNPCNLPGGKTVCDKVEDGAMWLAENTGALSVAENVSEVVDFATDPLGYMEQRLRSGTKSMFGAFGEKLTGKKPKKGKKE
ncbi:hypothetical protein AB0A60_19330 [Streptomyces sp. NPDC046275]|uniref:hypothetical protein n=1 Tax=Streptomyces sp. NPDC046275 TaxID=3157201 RepID=UPI003406E7A1